MQAPFNNIVQHLFHQPSLHSVTVHELENMAEQHPYFAAAHFLLLKKMQDTSHPLFNKQLQKTTLYFNNPLWLQYLLQPETAGNFTVSEKAPFISGEASTPVAQAGKSEAENIADMVLAAGRAAQQSATKDQEQLKEIVYEPLEHRMAEPVVPQTHGGIMDVITDVFHDNTAQITQPFFENGTGDTAVHKDAFTAASPETANVTEPIAQNMPAEGRHGVLEETKDAEQKPAFTYEPVAIAGDGHTVTAEEYSPAANNTTQDDTEIKPEAGIEPIPTPAVEEIHFIETAATVEAVHEPILEENKSNAHQELIENPDAVSAEINKEEAINRENNEPAEQSGETSFAATFEAATSPDEKPLIKTIVETPAAKNDFLFEPYHTVDYFASQGIKLSKMEADSKDRLGRQLKSFTEWLRSMKKLPQVSIEKILSENEESKVMADARHSIENKEVITEAMAEVFEKQGMAEKAADVYRKLSLQNPGKSVYFAAKIEELKH